METAATDDVRFAVGAISISHDLALRARSRSITTGGMETAAMDDVRFGVGAISISHVFALRTFSACAPYASPGLLAAIGFAGLCTVPIDQINAVRH